MLTKKSLLIAGAVTTLGVAGAFGTHAALATYHTNNDDGLVEKIAQEFNLQEAAVQAVFDDYKSDQEAKRTSEYLQKLVDKGKITAEQKTLIENKLSEISDAKNAEMAELRTWAEANGVSDVDYITKGLHKDSGYLQKLVDEGKLTAAQKTAIEAKQTELRQKHDAAKAELKQWLKDNNINEKYLMMDWGRHDNDSKGHHDNNDWRH